MTCVRYMEGGSASSMPRKNKDGIDTAYSLYPPEEVYVATNEKANWNRAPMCQRDSSGWCPKEAGRYRAPSPSAGYSLVRGPLKTWDRAEHDPARQAILNILSSHHQAPPFLRQVPKLLSEATNQNKLNHTGEIVAAVPSADRPVYCCFMHDRATALWPPFPEVPPLADCRLASYLHGP